MWRQRWGRVTEKKSENTIVPTTVHASCNNCSGAAPAASTANTGCSATSETAHEPTTRATIIGVVSSVSPSTASTGLPVPPVFFAATAMVADDGTGSSADVSPVSTADDFNALTPSTLTRARGRRSERVATVNGGGRMAIAWRVSCIVASAGVARRENAAVGVAASTPAAAAKQVRLMVTGLRDVLYCVSTN